MMLVAHLIVPICRHIILSLKITLVFRDMTGIIVFLGFYIAVSFFLETVIILNFIL
jgi:hypothetical protein